MFAVPQLGGLWVYLVPALLVFGESAFFLGLVLPGETSLVVAGFLAGSGHARLAVLIPVAVAAAVLGDVVGYVIGRRGGPALRRTRAAQLIPESAWLRGERWLDRRGAAAVAGARFVAVVRALMPTLAGIGGLSLRRFLVADLVGGAAWVSAATGAGALAARLGINVAGWLTYGPFVFVAVVATVALWRLRRRLGRLLGRRQVAVGSGDRNVPARSRSSPAAAPAALRASTSTASDAAVAGPGGAAGRR